MHHMKRSLPPLPPSSTAERVRVTVPVTHDTLEAFRHYADLAGVSVGRAMADWLGEQLDAVTWQALRFEELRDEMRETPRAIAEAVAAGGGRQADARPGAAGSPPRPVIRGGKSRGTS